MDQPAIFAEWYSGEIPYRETEIGKERRLISGTKDQFVEVTVQRIDYLVIQKGVLLKTESRNSP